MPFLLTNEEIENIRLLIGRNCRWNPIVGGETRRLIEASGLDAQTQRNVVSESLQILSKGARPDGATFNNTGLVVGYVQSGKTLSFTTVSALARDNNFPLVIVIAGIANNLFNQSNNRLKKDLRLDDRNDNAWSIFENPDLQNGETIDAILSDWRDENLHQSQKQTVLITVLKHHRRLQSLSHLLRAIDMTGLSALVIDDEADQASMNTLVNDDEESTTYARLLELRESLPSHTFLQYTATPQAPLLISVIDQLSPDFNVVLTPGEAYTGGREFFTEGAPLVRIIPDADLPSRDNILHSPPGSLIEALQFFYLAVAAGYIVEGGRGTRSMMIHPSRLTNAHGDYVEWISDLRDEWLMYLEQEDGDVNRGELIASFKERFDDLQATAPDCPEFQLLLPNLRRALRRTAVTEVNATPRGTTDINWGSSYSHILVGGQSLDRGFTVIGLTVTYMPRGLGVGNADTLQQRARFFGYRANYLGYCRIYLENASERAFRSYVDHEESIRGSLVALNTRGGSLTEWRRAFFLDTALRATRASVISSRIIQDSFSNKWFIPSEAHANPEVVVINNELVRQYIDRLHFVEVEGDPRRTPMQTPMLCANLTLREVFENLLVPFRLVGQDDSQKYIGILLQIEKYLQDHPNALVDIYQIASGAVRERGLQEDGKMSGGRSFFQGANREYGNIRKGEVYPGDHEFRDGEKLTLQIHNIQPKDMMDAPIGAPVQIFAIWIPAPFARGWLVQDQ